MAEELDLRSIWKNSKENTAADKIDLGAGKKTKTTLYWIKFILWVELWLSVVCLIPFTYYFLTENQTGMLTFYLVITTVYLFYYLFLIRQIRSFHYDGNVVQSLKKVYGYLRFYLLHYKVVIWLSLVSGVLFAAFDPKNAETFALLITAKQWAIFIGIMVIMVSIIGGFFHGLIHLIYGRKIGRLKKMVKELESTN